jgi:pimeloyl-ACP methyl ester carboxylesterase
MSLQKPPKRDEPSRVVIRILVLLILLLAVAVAVWSAVINQRIDLVENTSASSLELEESANVDGRRIHFVSGQGGSVQVVLLHDLDVTGSALLAGVAAEIGANFKPTRVDLPGYGLSDRIPGEGPDHTVAYMAETVGTFIDERFSAPVVVAGVGLGGEVAAELAVNRPDLVRGVVLVDVDFWEEDGWKEIGERLPYVGRAITYTLESGGRFGVDNWAPYCDSGGWCPSPAQEMAREKAVAIAGSTDTIRSHRQTLPSSLVPADLGSIEVPVAYVHSTRGDVPDESVDRIVEKLPDLLITEVDVWQAHLESPGLVAEAIEAASG